MNSRAVSGMATTERSEAQALRDFYEREDEAVLSDEAFAVFHDVLLGALERGTVRAARFEDGEWRAEPWVKRAILLGFRATETVEVANCVGPAFDRAGYLPRTFAVEDGVRLVPGGSLVRRGAHVASSVVIMPPSYVNVGAFIDRGSMVDSLALVGSCAQVGRDVHLSTGAKLGGVLEPAGAVPVVVEDGCFLGADSGVFEGVVVRRGAVLAPGVLLTAATKIYDLERGKIFVGEVPSNAVVVPGSRPLAGSFAEQHGLSAYAPVIVKYRDASTDASTALEGALR